MSFVAAKNPDAFPSKKELQEDEEEQENGKISLRSAIETQWLASSLSDLPPPASGFHFTLNLTLNLLCWWFVIVVICCCYCSGDFLLYNPTNPTTRAAQADHLNGRSTDLGFVNLTQSGRMIIYPQTRTTWPVPTPNVYLSSFDMVVQPEATFLAAICYNDKDYPTHA